MKVLLDTNIVIHREASHILNKDIGILFKWLDKGKYEKCIHPVTVSEIEKNRNRDTADTFSIKLQSYETLKTTTPLQKEVESVALKIDVTRNDENDTILLNEVFCGRVDFLITEDRKIHLKAEKLGISDRVFKIDSFLEKVVSENPELVNYNVLAVSKSLFGEINLEDTFFDSFKEDYPGFAKWFLKKSDEIAYVTVNMGHMLSFLYLKIEDKGENYADISPSFVPKKRLKIGTFKVISNGVRLGERFIKIIFDNALRNHVDEIYVTIFDKSEEQKRLIGLLEEWGFVRFGKKKSAAGDECVFVRDFKPTFNLANPCLTYPFISKDKNIFLIPIHPDYHTELLPDSYLATETADHFSENRPHRNALSKVFITRSIKRDVQAGDILIFYRTAPSKTSAYFTSVITTIGVVAGVTDGIKDEEDFILKCRKRSIFTDAELREWWNFNPKFRPFIINFLYVCSFQKGKRINRKKLIELGILTGQEGELRGLTQISKEKFELILKETETNESIIVD
jgi:predicted nucleic acid-binding protein